MSANQIPDEVWGKVQQHLGYNDEEMELSRKDPRNTKVLITAVDMQAKSIVFEVIESHGCNSQHKVGTRFFFSGDGNLISRMSPSKVCAFVLPIMTQAPSRKKPRNLSIKSSISTACLILFILASVFQPFA